MHHKLTLATIGGGGLAEDFDREIRRLCENIADPNIPTEAKRSITVTVKVKPDKKGLTAAVTYSVTSSLPGAEPGEAVAWIAMVDNQLGLYEADRRQDALPFNNPEPLVTEIKPTAGANKLAEMPAPRMAPPQAND